jgi:hypothetical protein
VNVALALAVVASGPERIVVSGGVAVASTVHSYRAGVGSVSAGSPFTSRVTAWTRNTWWPASSSVYTAGDSHWANGSPSSAHSKIAPGLSDVKWNVALMSVVVAGGPARIVVSGGVVSAGASIVQV